MALRIRKDIKKSSYYVWFLGAKESKGLRGKEFIIPIIDHLVLREKELEPHKVTLQVSHKGLKIIQNVLSTNKSSNKPKSEIIKHFLPHDTITCVYQNEDIVSVLLILYNPITKCPLHCHVYRCDSVETASLLKKQLELLIQRPENQKKYGEFEDRLKLKVEARKKKFDSSLGSDTGISTRESTSSDEHLGPDNQNNRISTLYDSLAAELRQKLNTKQTPILLPPRDYDTVHRQKGNLQNIDLRRCLNTSIVGQNAKNGRRIESSGGSSGIGSDHAPSPEGEEGFVLDNQSTSDDEWNADQFDTTNYQIQNSTEMILPRASRNPENSKLSPEIPKSPEYKSKSPEYHSEVRHKNLEKKEEYFNSRYEDPKLGPRFEDPRYPENNFYFKPDFEEEVEKSSKEVIPRPRTKYFEEEEIPYCQYEDQTKPESQNKYYDDKTLSRGQKQTKDDPRYYPDFEEKYYDSKTLEKNPKYAQQSNPRHYVDKPRTSEESSRYYNQEEYPESRRHPKDEPTRRYQDQKSSRSSQIPEEYFQEIQEQEMRRNERRFEQIRSQHQESFFDDDVEIRRHPEERQRSPTPPEINVSPRDRFKDAKEKFLLMERQRLEEQERARQEEIRRRQELASNMKDKTFLKRHDSIVYPKNPYQEDVDPQFGYQPKAAPRNLNFEEMREYTELSEREMYLQRREREERLRNCKDPRDPRDVRNLRDNPRDGRDFRDAHREMRDLRDSRDSRNPRELRDSRDVREISRDVRELPRDVRELKDSRDVREIPRDSRELKESRDVRDLKDPRDVRDIKESRDPRDSRNNKERQQYQEDPRSSSEVIYRRREPLDRYRSSDYDKRRSMFSQIEEEHKTKSNEIARELKRRSYLENTNYDRDYGSQQWETQDVAPKRYPQSPNSNDYQFSKSNTDLDKLGGEKLDKFEQRLQKNSKKHHQPAGYRHSYAEPKLSHEKLGKKMLPEILHRTNSSVSNSGRVGIASVNPY